MIHALCQVYIPSQIARFIGPTWDPPGADRTQVDPMLAPWTLLSGIISAWYGQVGITIDYTLHEQISWMIYQQHNLNKIYKYIV